MSNIEFPKDQGALPAIGADGKEMLLDVTWGPMPITEAAEVIPGFKEFWNQINTPRTKEEIDEIVAHNSAIINRIFGRDITNPNEVTHE